MNIPSNRSSPSSKSLAVWSTPQDKSLQHLCLLQGIHHPCVDPNPFHHLHVDLNPLHLPNSTFSQEPYVWPAKLFERDSEMFGVFFLQCELTFSQTQIRCSSDHINSQCSQWGGSVVGTCSPLILSHCVLAILHFN